jgi:hypothetical protein
VIVASPPKMYVFLKMGVNSACVFIPTFFLGPITRWLKSFVLHERTR